MDEATVQRAVEPFFTTGHRRVLLVDDDAWVRATAAASLRMARFEVLEAAGGTKALRIPEDTADAHALVTDDAMPRQAGAELARRLRERKPDLPVLPVTGYADLEDLYAAALPRLGKPFRPEALVAAVEALPGIRAWRLAPGPGRAAPARVSARAPESADPRRRRGSTRCRDPVDRG